MTPEQVEKIVQIEWEYHQRAAQSYWETRGEHPLGQDPWEDKCRELSDSYYSDWTYEQFKALFISDRGLDINDQSMEIAA